MSNVGKRGKLSWHSKLRNAAMNETGCSLTSEQAFEAYCSLIQAKPGESIFGRRASVSGDQ